MVPLYSSLVSAGFPHTVSADIDTYLNLESLIIKRPTSTYFVKVDGDSMINASIYSGDILVVDKSIVPSNGDIVIAFLNGGACVKRFQKEKNRFYLLPENEKYKKIEINEDDDFEIWGVVTYVIHKA